MPLHHSQIPDDPYLREEAAAGSRKRLFIGLITGACFLLCALLALLWIVPYVGLGAIHPWMPALMGFVFSAAILVITWAWLGLVLRILLGRSLPFSSQLRGLAIKFFLPLMTLLGRALGIPKENVRGSFIKVNNELVRSEVGKYKPGQMLLLMPHCLQSSRCKLRLTYDINNCKRCGKCAIKGLLELSERYGIHLAIATGGTIARRIVVQTRPRIILAVACERDLASGIQDTYPIPVFGVLNSRPNGPCLDTDVSLSALENAIQLFLDEQSKAEIAKRPATKQPKILRPRHGESAEQSGQTGQAS